MTAVVKARRTRGIFGVCLFAAMVLGLAAALPAAGSAGKRGIAAAAAAAGQTYVSISFDDGYADQYTARSILASHAMHGTFFINSGNIEASSKYLTWQQVRDLAGDGNEIGGHTVLHPDLTTLDASEQAREVCNDRSNLIAQGFDVRDFAYPFGAWNSGTTSILQQCGYVTGRTNEELDPLFAQAVPPADPYRLHTPPGVTSSTSLATVQSWVTNAEQHGGGWIEIRIHHICNGCDPASMTSTDFTALLDWLQPRAATGTVVSTVHDVFGGPLNPAVPGPPPPAAPSPVINPSVESDADTNGVPDCFEQGGYGTNTPTWTRVTDAHTGTYAERLQLTNFTSGAGYLIQKLDLGQCAPTVNAGRSYRLGIWYKSDAQPRYNVYYRTSLGGWRFWTSSALYPTSVNWSQATFITPQVPAGATGISFGLDLESAGTLTTDDYSLAETEQVPPTVSVTAPAGGSTVSGSITVTADASDDVGVDHVDFLRNGIFIGTDSTAPYSISWDTGAARNGSHAITARALDSSLNSTTSSPVNVTVLNTPPVGVNNYSLEGDLDGNNAPDCFEQRGSAAAPTGTYTRTADAHTGAFAERVDYAPTTTGLDQKLMIAFNSGCAVPVTPGQKYQLSAWYKSTVPVRISVYLRDGTTGSFSQPGGAWRSPLLPASAGWSRAVWVTAAVPAGISHLSFGLAVETAGSVTTDDYDAVSPADTTAPNLTLGVPADGATVSGSTVSMTATTTSTDVDHVTFYVDSQPVGIDTTSPYAITWDSRTVANGAHTWTAQAIDTSGNWTAKGTRTLNTQNDVTPPTVALTAPAAGAQVSGSVSLSADASDNVAVDHVDFNIDGAVVGTDTSSPYQVSWNSTTAANGNHQVTAVAYDAAGNSTTSSARTVDVENDTAAPSSSINCNGSACQSGYYTASVSVTLTATDSGGSGLDQIRYTLDGSTPTLANGQTYTTAFTLSQTATVKYRAWDVAGNVEAVNSQLIQVDTAAPSVSLTAPADGAQVSGSVSLTADASDDVAVDHVDFKIDGSVVGSDTSSPYETSWNATTASNGNHQVTAVAYDAAGNSTTSSARTVDVENDTAAPVTTISCNGGTCSGWFGAAVSVTLSATDSGSGVAAIRYTLDGTDPTSSSSLYSGPFSVSSTTTVKYRAWDTAGNVEAVQSQLIQIATAAPVTTISCNGGACSGWFGSAVSVTLSATDNGSGIAAIRYTLDGTDPTSSSSLYSGPFSVSSTTTVKYRAWDNAGNVEDVKSQLIQFDSLAPVTTISCNGGACSGWFRAAVSVTLSASDGGSGVAAIRYTLDGTDPTSSSSLYGGPITVSSTTTVKYRAWDTAGNVEAVNSQLIQVDSLAPVTTIRCNGVACSAWYSSAVSVTLSAADSGSGVAAIRYTLDGTNPTASSTLYSGPISISTTKTVKYRAWDTAGNIEAVKSQLIQIDSLAPTVAITAPTNGKTVTGTVKVTASAADTGGSGVASVAFYVDGTLLDTATSSPWFVNWNTKKSTKGQHTLYARATDKAGNQTQSASITVTVT